MAFSLFGRRPQQDPEPEETNVAPQEEPQKRGFFDRMRQAVTRTRESFAESIGQVIALTREVDQSTLDDLEPVLLAADIGSATTAIILENLRQRALRVGIEGGGELKELLRAELQKVLDGVARPVTHPATAPEVIMMVGVNGTGQDDDLRQAGAVVYDRRPQRAAVCGGYVSRGGDRAA